MISENQNITIEHTLHKGWFATLDTHGDVNAEAYGSTPQEAFNMLMEVCGETSDISNTGESK